ncbi:tRNA lysidine(34) synthetase TilS [Pseudomonas neustonica]|uniref:tRNA(Ile)-lysidine synthase n=2 Tax=Pseudomonas TaxID=286 RepID=A0ABX9XKF5_9PSED|nr:tRNA lysidine(34) synthetase TilS [Pseudomonas sp. SSM44]ROZ86703.1 tRNA lysidine(34) synthetase TilS [Pseudomonas neustonica]|tara:strand:+ start:3955 stop:5271 length:1317 start_codon:yes stop_codon:yes gene_type:complete
MFTLQGLQQQLGPCMNSSAWIVGLSGGLDSMVLLDALVQLRDQLILPPLSAMHIHHGLSAEADAWVAFCEQECAKRGVELYVERVQLAPGASIEEAARSARYQAFAVHLPAGATLLLAHHRDDQLETLLFRMMRGTGLRGLAGMPAQRQLAAGQLLRPLLPWRRRDLELWAREHGLAWIEDPANRDPRFARTALRHQLLPALRDGWPQAEEGLLRLAGHAGEANELLDERAAEDLSATSKPLNDVWLRHWPSLDMDALSALSPARQRNLLRYWLAAQGALLPASRRLDEWLGQLAAATDSQPQIDLGEYRLYRSSGRLWFVRTDWPSAGVPQACTQSAVQLLAGGNGLLHLALASASAGPWHIRYRQGGEHICLPGRGKQSLKHLFQQAQIPVWLRPCIPLLYCADELVSVAGRWNAEPAVTGDEQSGFTVSWEPVSD